MPDTLQVIGVCKTIAEQDTGWTHVEVEVPGRQYPIKLSTNRAPLIDAVRVLHGSSATFSYTERESQKINQNTGRPYTNRYLEAVAPIAGSAPPEAPQAPPTAHHAPVHVADKDRTITRMACLKSAAAAMAGTLPTEPTDPQITHVLRVAARFEQWVYRDIDQVPF